MSAPALNTRLAIAATVAAAAADAAAAASAAALPPQLQGQAPGAPVLDAPTMALQALTAMLAQQHLDSLAIRAEAAASRAAQEVASQLALAQQCRAAAGPAPLFVGISLTVVLVSTGGRCAIRAERAELQPCGSAASSSAANTVRRP